MVAEMVGKTGAAGADVDTIPAGHLHLTAGTGENILDQGQAGQPGHGDLFQHLVALHHQRAVFADKQHILPDGFKQMLQVGVLPSAGGAEQDALLPQLSDKGEQFGEQLAAAGRQQRAVDVACNQPNHGKGPPWKKAARRSGKRQ